MVSIAPDIDILPSVADGINKTVQQIRNWSELNITVAFKNKVSVKFSKEDKLSDEFIDAIIDLKFHLRGSAIGILSNNKGDKVHAHLGNLEDREESGHDLLLIVKYLRETFETERKKMLTLRKSFLLGLM